MQSHPGVAGVAVRVAHEDNVMAIDRGDLSCSPLLPCPSGRVFSTSRSRPQRGALVAPWPPNSTTAGGIGPVSVSFWRFLTGLGLLLAAHLARRSRRPETATSLRETFAANRRQALITGFGLAVYQTAYFASVQQAGLTVATVVTLGSGPVLVSVGARFMLGEHTGAAGTAAVASGVVGLVLLMGGADGNTGPDPVLGIGYALLSAMRLRGRDPAGTRFRPQEHWWCVRVDGDRLRGGHCLPSADGSAGRPAARHGTCGMDPGAVDLLGGGTDGAGVHALLHAALASYGRQRPP